MRTRTIKSGTEKYPTPRDVLAALLIRLIEKNSSSCWAHFELVAKGGWFWNYVSGKEPWIEVAIRDNGFLELNLGFPKSRRPSIPPLPEKWPQKSKNVRVAPMSDRDELVAWIENCFAKLSENPAYRVMGWLDGL